MTDQKLTILLDRAGVEELHDLYGALMGKLP